MAHRLLPLAVLTAAALSATLASCADDGGGAEPLRTTDRAVPVGTGYTSDQLEQALLTEVSGYERAGEPDSGEYGSLKAIQNFDQLQDQVTLDKPRCANAAGRPAEVDSSTPTAIVTFARGNGQTATETLMAMTAAAAERQVKTRVPAGCLTFRTRVGSQWSEHRVFEAPPGDLGAGSRTVGVTTTSGGAHTKTWYVVLSGRRFLATISLYGPNATRAEAEQLARAAYDQARRILP
ncbi:hypothetical protein Acsp04_42740 [Actinomadura sp. NBRC 104425]|uniref:hypothetical protein n=1 Tax=Actinomadura sp. NBRC 104425 TaxID=3032204 RepID=UPI0024A1A01E|nr:hypothetical protein [Actinomadura sp. NBRC 104425]GLZ14039.1 hypothetical protein Acsp04_42740 [Actinomadura sp. NBRC 104425]